MTPFMHSRYMHELINFYHLSFPYAQITQVQTTIKPNILKGKISIDFVVFDWH